MPVIGRKKVIFAKKRIFWPQMTKSGISPQLKKIYGTAHDCAYNHLLGIIINTIEIRRN